MRIITYLSIIAALLTACGDSIEKQRAQYCASVGEKALKEIEKGNLRPALAGQYAYSNFERYYIWKKYQVNITYPVQLDEFYSLETDSCYNAIMLAHAPADAIIRDLDSLAQLNQHSGYECPLSKYIYAYHDDTYFVGLDARNKSLAPTRLDTNYYAKLEKFKAQFEEHLSDTLECEFWYEIDTCGIVTNIEIVHHATNAIDEAATDFYASFEYVPANDSRKKLKYRNIDSMYFLGRQKK